MVKRILFAILLLALVGIFAGCCANPKNAADTTKSFANCEEVIHDWTCANRAKIVADMATANATITALNAEFGGMIPAPYQAIVIAAQLVLTQGQAILNSISCPTDADVQTVASATLGLTTARAKANAMRMGLRKPLIP